MSGKLSREEVSKRLSDRDLELVGEYDGIERLVRVRCGLCGNIRESLARNFLARESKWCTECWTRHGSLRKIRAGESRWTGYGEISGRYWKRLIKNANIRGVDFRLGIEDAWQIYLDQQKCCALSGVVLVMHVPNHSSDVTASLDRINSKAGYRSDNVWWLHKTVNEMKWDLDLAKFIGLCGLVLRPLEGSKTVECVEREHHWNWRGYGNISGNNWDVIRANAVRRGISFGITIECAWDLFVDQNGRCAITGLPLALHSGRTASLDRIDSALPYEKSNLRWVHKDINSCLKKGRGDNEMHMWCDRIINNDS